MAINMRLLKRLLLTSLFLFGLSVLQAQTAGYFLDTSSAEPRFVQRLTWSGGAYSLRYEVIVEKEKGGSFASHLTEITTDNFVYLSLSQGNYRFRVISYDILNKPSTETRWEPFEVFKAVKPVLYQPEKELKYTNDARGVICVFEGKDIDSDAKGYFVNAKGEHIVPVDIINSDDGSSISLVFGKDQLIDGEYKVFVINPGGLEGSLDGVNFKSPPKQLKPINVILGVSLMPLHPVYGDGFGNGWIFNNISRRISLSFYMVSETYIGLELLFSKCSDDIVYGPEGLTVGYNLLFLKWTYSHKTAYNLRMGLSYAPQPLSCSYLNIGASALFNITQYLNIDAGINFTSALYDRAGGAILPCIGMSIMF